MLTFLCVFGEGGSGGDKSLFTAVVWGFFSVMITVVPWAVPWPAKTQCFSTAFPLIYCTAVLFTALFCTACIEMLFRPVPLSLAVSSGRHLLARGAP